MQAIEWLFLKGEASTDDILNYSLICWIIGRRFDSFPKTLPGGYTLLRNNANFIQPLDCFGYVLTEKECLGKKRFREVLERDFTEVNLPEMGDIVVYFHDTVGIVHAGIYLGGQKVESKWNIFGSVFIHPLDVNISNECQPLRFYKPKR
ncbi:MAG: hypothetical protein NC927_01435 [Candidatus Omnitrophica bacterium]|nr:hypothetical protein [Candidatus Omnitrophota bacterium]